jgi:hypothetical protein
MQNTFLGRIGELRPNTTVSHKKSNNRRSQRSQNLTAHEYKLKSMSHEVIIMYAKRYVISAEFNSKQITVHSVTMF